MKGSINLFTIIVFILTLVLLGFSISCQRQVQEGMTEEEVQAWTNNVLKMWNEANLNIVDEVYAPEIIRHDCGLPEAIVGHENIKKHLENFFNAFPNLNITVDETIAVGNKLAQRWTLTGTYNPLRASQKNPNLGRLHPAQNHTQYRPAPPIWN